ncbi:hypothetical protein [Sphingomonas sp. RS2018]
MRDGFRGMAALLQRLADGRQARGDVARDLGRASGGVQAVRVQPDGAQTRANRGIVQVVEIDPEARTIRELAVILSLPGEVGEEFQTMADVADDQEGRPATSR